MDSVRTELSQTFTAKAVNVKTNGRAKLAVHVACSVPIMAYLMTNAKHAVASCTGQVRTVRNVAWKIAVIMELPKRTAVVANATRTGQVLCVTNVQSNVRTVYQIILVQGASVRING